MKTKTRKALVCSLFNHRENLFAAKLHSEPDASLSPSASSPVLQEPNMPLPASAPNSAPQSRAAAAFLPPPPRHPP